VLDNLASVHPREAIVATALLRLYSGVFSGTVTIQPLAIARKLRLEQREIVQALERLANWQIIEFAPAAESPEIFFSHRRTDSNNLILNLGRIQMLRQRHAERTAAMLNFLQNDSKCRFVMLRQYFGEEKGQPCGSCDVCKNGEQGNQINSKSLDSELIMLIGSGMQTIEALMQALPQTPKEQVLGRLRELWGEGKLSRESSGLFIVLS
jgi:ATP-dependent DNA helicase RecQ